MQITELLDDLSARNVRLWVEGDRLRYRAPKDVLTPGLLSIIRRHKSEILKRLRGPAETSEISPPLSAAQSLQGHPPLGPVSHAQRTPRVFSA